MNNVYDLESLPKHRRTISRLLENVISSRQRFIDSLSLAQYTKFKKLFRADRLNLNVDKISKNKNIKDLFYNWAYHADVYNHVFNDDHVIPTEKTTLKLVA
jgi:hypothetical protein